MITFDPKSINGNSTENQILTASMEGEAAFDSVFILNST